MRPPGVDVRGKGLENPNEWVKLDEAVFATLVPGTPAAANLAHAGANIVPIAAAGAAMALLGAALLFRRRTVGA